MPGKKISQENTTLKKLTIKADLKVLNDVKSDILRRLGQNTKVPGFRIGKAPIKLLEQNIPSDKLQSEFLDEAINRCFTQTVNSQKIRPIGQPQVTITKFVPFTDLEFVAEVESIGDIKLPLYREIRLARKPVEVVESEVDGVMHELQLRAADKEEIKRAAKEGDQVVIDFSGHDKLSGKAVNGATATDYPLILGSNTFIPGFEAHIIGLKTSEQKTFDIKFPSNYSVATLRNRQVIFDIKMKKIFQLKLPKVNAVFVQSISPFKTVDELRDDIKKQLLAEKQSQADAAYDNELLQIIAKETVVDIPEMLISEESGRLKQQEIQNLNYRGQTWLEYLEETNQDEETIQKQFRENAIRNIVTGLALTEIADRENISVSDEEFQTQLRLMKEQYQDQAMQTELLKPENQRSILSQMLSQKTIFQLRSYASSKTPPTNAIDSKSN